ncbi:HK97 family phage prohead protease [Mycolicibacterium moriokaense]|nr:HK97 family phage prohead protease [Mycolicibacterium moriokaense]
MKADLSVWEYRSRIEQRSDSETLTLTGYASTFDDYQMYGGPSAGGWIERVDRHAFDETLRENPDLHLLVNHEGLPLARTRSGTLVLSVDDHGLKVVATLDRSDPDVQRLEPKMRRGDLTEMSFAFRVKAQTWSAAPGFDDPESLRLIQQVDLHKGDVSVVNFGANSSTSATIRSLNPPAEIDGRTQLIRVRIKTLSKGNSIVN